VTIFLYGPDGYRRTKRLHNAFEQFLHKYPGLGIRRVDAELDANPAALVADLLSSASLFSPRTLVVLDSALTLTPDQLLPLIAKTVTSATNHLIFVADTDKITKPYARLLEPDIQGEVFPVLTGSEWAAFVAREAKAREVTLSKQELQALTYAFPGDSWGLATELDVLRYLIDAERAVRLRNLSTRSFSGAPNWGELRKLGSGPIASRLVTLANIEATGDAAAKTFAMAAYTANPKTAALGDRAVKQGGWDYEEALLALALY
jgi:DNA polymerase III delta subunit